MTRFDRVVPPGGEGKITLRVDLKGYQGRVVKNATVISNDPRQPTAPLTLLGTVRPFIEIRPGTFVQFYSGAEASAEKTVDLTAVDRDFQILKVENGLAGKIDTRLETVAAGRHYRLKMINRQKEGDYFGLIKLATDHPQKTEIQIQVSGRFTQPR